jgi:5,6-dimethylbenzimidazole synthase
MTFDKNDRDSLKNIITHRRDVRGNLFIKKKIKNKVLNNILKYTLHAPSVGFSQPWEIVIIKDKKIKKRVYKNFKKENKKASKYFGKKYNKLKLEGIKESPINIAIYYKPSQEKILGQTSQNKMGEYSVVCAIQNLWLIARAYNIGVGWVSILNPKKVNKILKVKDNQLVAYLCMGYVKKFYKEPELLKREWAKRKDTKSLIKLR